MSELSIVIPTYNAGDALRRSLPPLASMAAVGLLHEVILADGGSDDATAAIAEDSGAVLITAPKGRGGQLAAGGDAARGGWLLFLHADTVLEPGWEDAVRTFIADPENADRAAYFGYRLDDRTPMACLLEAIVGLRCRLLRLPYGDQGLLISREHYLRVGGFREIPPMEDVDIVRRIGRRRLSALPCNAVTSAVRYRRDGYLRRPLRNLFCLALYFLGVPPRSLLRFYG
jgi:rSAM/selenodomain-associated transferase 2